jgi:hypothetical protein
MRVTDIDSPIVVKPLIEAQTNIDLPIVVKPIEAPRKIDLFYKAKHLNQICYLSSNIHQGNEIFSVHSRGKQCAFMSLSAVNRPLIVLYLFVWESAKAMSL